MEENPGRAGRRLLAVAAGFISFLVVRVALDGRVSVAGAVLLTPSVGLVVPLGILFGLPGAVGVLAGSLAAQAVQAGLPLFGVFESLSLFALGVVSAAGWQSRIALAPGSAVDVDDLPGLAVVAAVGMVGAASIYAWGGELLGLFPFYVTFVETLARYLVATAVVAPAVAALLLVSRPERLRSVGPAGQLGPGFALVPALWAAVAVVGSLGFNVRERIPLPAFENRGVELLYHLVHPDVFGSGGRRIQVAFGAVMLVAWAVTLGRRRRTGGEATAHGSESLSGSLDSDRTTVSSPADDPEVR